MRIKNNVALLGVLSALALALSFAESFLAPALPMGVKPGLSNIAVMLAASVLGLPAGLAVALMKAVFAGVARGLTAMLLSGAGGLLSALVMGILLQGGRDRAKRGAAPRALTETGAGILGGVIHNAAQLLLAMALTRTPGIVWSAPLLIVFGVVAGATTGTLAKLTRNYILR